MVLVVTASQGKNLGPPSPHPPWRLCLLLKKLKDIFVFSIAACIYCLSSFSFGFHLLLFVGLFCCYYLWFYFEGGGEWVIKYNNYDTHACVLSFATPWTIVSQAHLCMEFSRQEYYSRVPFPTQGDLHNSGIELCLLHLLHCQVNS